MIADTGQRLGHQVLDAVAWIRRMLRLCEGRPIRFFQHRSRALIQSVASLGVIAAASSSALAASVDLDLNPLAVAVAYEHGEGVEKDTLRAYELYCDAARGGNLEAEVSLAWMYANGRGVERDAAMAGLLISRAADRGSERAERLRPLFSERAAVLPECLVDRTSIEEDGRASSETSNEESHLDVPKRVLDLVSRLAPEYEVEPLLALAVIRVESNFDPNARSPKNAQGLMQLIPETAQRFNVRKPFDVEQNIRGGLAYLRWLLAYFRGRVAFVAAGYNAGEGAVDKFRGIPPYPETRAYVSRILDIYKKDLHPYDPAVLRTGSRSMPEGGRQRSCLIHCFAGSF